MNPQIEQKYFVCPHCKTNASHSWQQTAFYNEYISASFTDNAVSRDEFDSFYISFCTHCHKVAVWIDGKMVYPDVYIHEPNVDMPSQVLNVYKEAMSVANKSPRCACALLRLSIELLCDCEEINAKGRNLDEKIRFLVEKGLPIDVQMALDTVRVIGNKAIHAGNISVDYDNIDVANTLFSLVNMISQYLITNNKKLKELYAKLPKSAINSINQRNTKNDL